MFEETGAKFENAGCGLKIGWKFGMLVRKFEAGFERKFVGMKFEFGCEVQVDWKFGNEDCGLKIGWKFDTGCEVGWRFVTGNDPEAV